MRILVTGGAGFIGSHLTDHYVAAGHEVLIIDNLATGRLENINPAARFENLDLREFDKVDQIIAQFQPKLINHHAAQIDVRKSVADPIFDTRVNVLCSVNLLSSAAQHGVRGVLFASSGGTVYGETPTPAVETSPKAPISPYGAAKLSVESYMFCFASTRGLSTLCLRYGNVFGPRQDPRGEAGVISIFSGLLLDGKEAVIFGDGTAVRDYVMIEDIVRANALASDFVLSDPPPPTCMDDAAVNIGSGVSSSVNELYTVIASQCGVGTPARHVAPRDGELQESRLNAERARRVLGFRTEINLETGIERTIEWIRST